MKNVAKILGLILLAALAGCSSIEVNYDYDTTVDFSKYKTYAWMGGQGNMPEDPSSPMMSSGLLDQRIRSSVEWEMAERSMKESDDPDLLVIYHLGTQDKLQVTDWGYRYSDYYWGYGGRQVDVYQYTQGTLIIDVVEADTKNLVWRGMGQGVVDNTQRTPEQIQERIDGVVNKIMASFPPETAK